MSKVFPKLPKLSQNIPNVPNRPKCPDQLSKNIKNCPKTFINFQKMSQKSEMLPKKKHKKNPKKSGGKKHCTTSQNNAKCPKTSHNVTKHPQTHLNIPKNTKTSLSVPNLGCWIKWDGLIAVWAVTCLYPTRLINLRPTRFWHIKYIK